MTDLGARARWAWIDQAACMGTDASLWFPAQAGVEEVAEARRVCSTCPVQAECRAVGESEQWGIWAGTSEQDRRRQRAAG